MQTVGENYVLTAVYTSFLSLEFYKEHLIPAYISNMKLTETITNILFSQ